MRIRLAILIVFALLLSGCANSKFELLRMETTNPRNAKIKALLEGEQLPTLVNSLNRCLKLPTNIDIIFMEDEGGARYEKHQIIITYDFLAELHQKLDAASLELNDSQKDGIIVATAHFILLHELGHALIEVLDIPVVGKEEDAVDGLASVIAVGLLKRPELAIAAAVAMGVDGDEFSEQEYWDEHSLNTQRYYNILCWVHGGAPQQCEELVGELAPEDWFETRAESCQEEYRKLARNWSRLLEPHLKPGIRILARAGRHVQEHKNKSKQE